MKFFVDLKMVARGWKLTEKTHNDAQTVNAGAVYQTVSAILMYATGGECLKEKFYVNVAINASLYKFPLEGGIMAFCLKAILKCLKLG